MWLEVGMVTERGQTAEHRIDKYQTPIRVNRHVMHVDVSRGVTNSRNLCEVVPSTGPTVARFDSGSTDQVRENQGLGKARSLPEHVAVSRFKTGNSARLLRHRATPTSPYSDRMCVQRQRLNRPVFDRRKTVFPFDTS